MIKDLPNKLKLLRAENRYTQRQLAQKLQVSPSIVSGYETGDRTPSLENLLALAKLYNCSTDYLLGMNADEPSIAIDTEGLTIQQITVLQDLVAVMKDEV
ncbi:MAG: helix-turn-helix transcriptional regulator [Eubacterium sp.]|nr:helix-turn-helix transcriptional regulator [Eubacterium sp.]